MEIRSKEVFNLVKIREEKRQSGEWKKADEIREEIEEMGYDTDDTSSGPRIRRR